MNNNEGLPKKQEIIESDEIKHFIEMREIRPEDFHFISELGSFDRNTIIKGLHNFFSFNKENSAAELRRIIKVEESESIRKLYAIAADFTDKYDWATTYHLVGILEKR